MTRIMRPLAYVGLAALAMSVGPRPAIADGFGLFGPRQTTFISPVETIYAAPVATSYVVPTTSVISSSYLVPTSRVVFRPTTYSLTPTIYRSSATLLPTSYFVGSSVLTPTRFYTGNVLATSSIVPTSVLYPSSVIYPSSIVYPTTSVITPSRIVYDAPVVESAPPVFVDRPPASSQGGSPGRSTQEDPPLSLDRPRQQNEGQLNGRGSALESRPLDVGPAPLEREQLEPDSPPPPAIPMQGEDDSIDNLPLPSELFDETRESRRPAFSTGVPGSTLAAVAGAIQGRVRESRSGRPVSGAIVTFSNASPSFSDRQAVTNERGEFRLPSALPAGDWSIIVSGQRAEFPTRTYPQITVVNGRIYDSNGRDYSKLVLDY